MPDSGTPVELLRGLAVLAEPPSKEHDGIIAALGMQAAPSSSEYSDVFMFQLYPYASVHLGQEGMMGGDARERVAGFWTAVGQTPPAEPDHLSALLGLYVGLTEQIAIANAEGASAEAMLLDQSRGALMQEHLAPWVFAYLDRVVELTSGPYGEWAILLRDVLRSEVTSGGALPVHLREAPPLPDPREDGSEAFLAGLLAPVRSGAIFTRSDLGRIASTLDVGLRAGERRYALEHILAQDAPGVLTALSEEAGRQAMAHAAREEWLGGTACFLADRALRTQTLLCELAESGALSAEEAADGKESGDTTADVS